MPPVTATFTGREQELAQLQQVLNAPDHGLIVQAIVGLGGVGKTQLAARYANECGAEYDLVVWIRAGDGGVTDLAELAARLGQSVRDLSPVDRRDVALERLRQGSERWLMVLDSVETPEQLRDCLPHGGSGQVLVTSRNRELRQLAPLLALDVFAPEDAVSYLTDRTGRADDGGAGRLARALGYLPLALAHAAAYCTSGISFDDYLELLEALPAEEIFRRAPQVFYERTVASTWRPSIDAAAADSPLARELLAVAAFFAPDAIPRFLLNGLIGGVEAIDRMRLIDGLTALGRFSLVTVEREMISVHRLLQKVIRDDARARGDDSALSRAVSALAAGFPQNPLDSSQWTVAEDLLAHIVAVTKFASEINGLAADHVRLINRACVYLHNSENRRNAEGRRGLAVARAQSQLQLALTAVESGLETLRPEAPESLQARYNLANAYWDAGRVSEAIATYRPLIVDRYHELGAEHPETLRTRHDLAVAYWADGRISEAIAIYEPLLEDRRRVLGDKHPDTLRTLHGLAVAYWADGRIGEAIAIYEPLLEDRKQVLGLEHRETLRTRHGLAGAYGDAGRIGEAIAIYEPLLVDQERLLGSEHPDTLRTRHDLARTLSAAGRPDSAIAIFI